MTERNTSVARSEDDSPAWSRPRTAFESRCPKCGHERFQSGYTRRILFNLLNRRCTIDAFCIDCNVCWPISEIERRVILRQLDLELQAHKGARSAWCSQRRESRDPTTGRIPAKPSESQLSLQQALRTLRAIRLRYEIDRRKSDARLRSVLVALSCADMEWVTAAIETLQKAITVGVTEAAGHAVQARSENVT
jgi:hypothetical protein